jgi:hypothetical protein
VLEIHDADPSNDQSNKEADVKVTIFMALPQTSKKLAHRRQYGTS